MSAFAQQTQEQKVTLNKEMIENLLTVLSPQCKTELEGAITAQEEFSNECKVEMQKALQTMGAGPGFAQQPYADSPGAGFDGAGDQQASAAKPAPKDHIVHPVLGIVIFVVLMFGGAAYFIIQRNQQMSGFAKKPKKLSKKKEEKLRMKGKQK
jgi:hypothetical protein